MFLLFVGSSCDQRSRIRVYGRGVAFFVVRRGTRMTRGRGNKDASIDLKERLSHYRPEQLFAVHTVFPTVSKTGVYQRQDPPRFDQLCKGQDAGDSRMPVLRVLGCLAFSLQRDRSVGRIVCGEHTDREALV